MKKMCFALALVIMMTFAFPLTASAVSINIEEAYSTGEAVLIDIQDDEAIDPANYEINILKPNGDTVVINPRQARWTAENQCFETYTIESTGEYKVTVKAKDGDSAEAVFQSRMFTRASTIFMIISVLIFLVTGAMVIKQRKSRKE